MKLGDFKHAFDDSRRTRMRSPTQMSRWLIDGSRRIAGQVTVSLCATAMVAAISQSFFKEPASQPAQPAEYRINESAALSLLKAGFQPGAAHARTYYPTEFEALAPLSVPSILLATPAIVTVREVAPAPTKPTRKAATASVPQGCSTDCPSVAAATVLPPARPAEHDVLSETRVQAAEAKPERARLLGIPLPGFVPTGDAIVRSGAAAVGSVYSLGATVVNSAASVIR